MDNLLEFIAAHWLLSIAFVFTLFLVILSEGRVRQRGASRVSAQQAVMLMNHENTTVIDIRDRPAFESGHILGAIHITMSDLLSDAEQMLKKHRDNNIILVCPNGMQSGNVGKQLRKKGFEKVNFLGGGIQNWVSENFPLTKD